MLKPLIILTSDRSPTSPALSMPMPNATVATTTSN